MIRKIKERTKRVLRDIFELGQHLGVDILPRNFYSEIPDFRELRRNNSWNQPRSMCGVNGADVDEQLAFVRGCMTEGAQVLLGRENVYQRACTENGALGYGPIEAEFLFCYAGRYKPRNIVQIGAGVTTAILLHAAQCFGFSPKITCIDPYPTEFLKTCAAEGRITLIPKRCQDVALEVLFDVGLGDLLFVDSTHTVKVGSEVNYLILEALPRLQGGCHVHFHDITFPYDYSPHLMTTNFFWNETALLLAFLTGNSRTRLLASMSQLYHSRPKELQTLLPNYEPVAMNRGLWNGPETGHFPSALYMEVAKER